MTLPLPDYELAALNDAADFHIQFDSFAVTIAVPLSLSPSYIYPAF